MKISYCPQCKVVTGAGQLPETVVMNGREVPYTYTHVVKGKTHTCKLVEVPENPQRPDEDAEEWLDRLRKDYASTLR
jgi:hypothetical protein